MSISPPRHPLLRRRLVWALLGIGATLAIAALLVFEPWKLFVDQVAEEPVPQAAGGAESVVLARGTLISHEHESSGEVLIIQLADGSRILRLQDLKTSNGPLLRVWLTDAPVLAGSEGWRLFDDGRYADLGDLKGNIGSSNYLMPAEVNLADYRSVSIWCARFHVSFAAAALEAQR
jgi:hypothetical protein